MAPSWRIGQVIQNRWTVTDIRPGGMGIVYIVHDREHRLMYAAKTFRPELFDRNPAVLARFKQEALTWINLDAHENVVRAHYIVEINDTPLLLLEFVGGGDLNQWMLTNRLRADLPQVLRFAIQCCDGLNHALSKGVKAHRDVKPQNCLIADDATLKVTDFGLAKAIQDVAADVDDEPKALGSELEISRTGAAAGTCTHMAPEQFADSKHVDVRADVYAFGVMLFQMVTGELPFTAHTWEQFAELHRVAPPPVARVRQPILAAVIETCLAKKPARRFSSFLEIRERLVDLHLRLTGVPLSQPKRAPDLNARQLSDKGLALADLGRPHEAIRCFDAAIAQDPRLAGVWSNKAGVLRSLGRHDEALICDDEAVARSPQDAAIWMNKGVGLSHVGRLAEALVCHERALALDEGQAKLWIGQALVLSRLGRGEDALISLDRALAIDPSDADAWKGRASILRRLERHAEAIGSYEKALELNPSVAETWMEKGIALHALGQPRGAIACFDTALKLNRNLAGAWLAKGAALLALPDFPEAMAHFEQAKRLGAEMADRLIAVAGEMLARHNPTQEKTIRDQAVEWFNKGVALAAVQQWQEALACYEKANQLNPNLKEVWINKGVVLGTLRRGDESISCFDRALEIDPTDAAIWYNKGVTLQNLGLTPQAVACLDEAHRRGHPRAGTIATTLRRAL